MRIIKALDFGNPMTSFPGVPLVATASIGGGGALILAVDGKCPDEMAYVVMDEYDNDKCLPTLPITIKCCAADGAGMLCDNTDAANGNRFIAVADENLSPSCALDATNNPPISYQCQRAPPPATYTQPPVVDYDPFYVAPYNTGIIGTAYAAGG